MHECNEMYLYELIEDYKDSTSQEEKNKLFHSFCSSIWSSNNKKRIYNKTINFKVRKDLLDTELGQIFNTWSEISYKYYKSITNDENWCSLIRQKINNIYIRYFDKEVIVAKEYIDLIKTPKRLYYEWVSGTTMEANTVTDLIDSSINKSEKVKQQLQLEKMTLSWDDYKQVIESFLHKCFENCILIEEYEEKESISSRLNFLTEDHFYVKYINKCLDGEIKKWQKQYYGIKRRHKERYARCCNCHKLYPKTNNNQKYCIKCAPIIRNNRQKQYMRRLRKTGC